MGQLKTDFLVGCNAIKMIPRVNDDINLFLADVWTFSTDLFPEASFKFGGEECTGIFK